MASNQLRYGFDPTAALKIRRCHQVSFERFMQKRIIQLLNKSPGLKAREIASQLELERKVVSLHLHENLEIFIQDPDTFGWSVIKSASFVLELTCGGTWLTDTHFEKALSKSGSPLDADHGHVTIKIPGERKILLCAAAKILAIANQLAAAKKKVELDFSENKAALSYLNRAGFVDRLDSTIKILPKRPSSSAAQRYNANNIGLVEFLEINAYGDNSDNVPERLKNSFIEAFGKNNSNKLFTVVSEFVANVEEHSGTVIPGFAGLQCYGSTDKRAKVITVISDSGKGICETLRPAIDEHLPLLAKKFDPSLPVSDPKLILHAILKGGLSSREGGGGAGLHNSHSKAVELNATIKIRQENFSVLMEYKAGVLENKSWTLNLPKLIGTHIVFEFSLTKTQPLLKLEP